MRSWVVCALLVELGACGYHPDYTGTHYRCDDGKCPTGFTCIASYCESSAPSDAGGDTVIGADADASMLSWWDPAFTRRARITITNASQTAMPVGFQVGVRVTLASLDSPTAVWDAMRLVRYDAGGATWTEKNRYEEGLGGTRTLWFKLDNGIAPGATNTDYWLYFSNPSPSAAPNTGGTVFDFYDAFDSATVNTTSWAIQGTPTQVASELILKPNDSIRSTMQVTPGHAVAISLTAPPNVPRFWVGLQRQTDFTDSDPWLIWINRSPTDTYAPPGTLASTIYPETYISAIGMASANDGTSIETLDSQKHWYTVQRMADRIIFKYDEQVAYQYALPAAYTPGLQIRLCNEGTQNISSGMVHTRQAVWPDPTVTIGPTEMH